MKTKKVNVTYYRMQYNDIIANMFTKYAREKIYFLDENNKLYHLRNGNRYMMPFALSKDLFLKCQMNLYPIDAVITDKTNPNISGRVSYYIMEENKYVIESNSGNNFSIHFDNAVIVEAYYFISSSGKVQKDIVGRDKSVETFRKATNNYFENKEDANKKLLSINLQFSK